MNLSTKYRSQDLREGQIPLEKDRYQKRAGCAREADAEKGGRLVSDRLRASVNCARKQKRKDAS